MVRDIVIYEDKRNPSKSTLGHTWARIEDDGEDADFTAAAAARVNEWCEQHGHSFNDVRWAWVL